MNDALEQLVREAREDLGKQEVRSVDWEAVDRGLFGRIAREEHAELAHPTRRAGLVWAGGAMAFAVAAIAALIVGRTHEQRSFDAAQSSAEDRAGNVVEIEGAGEVLVGAKAVAVGATLRLGDSVETRGSQATIERPGKVAFVVERGSRATVRQVQGALILALDRGAIEAQVVPVARGEAFAIDVGHSRVAVHGTHLRVARMGDRVVMDLSEGVVSVGEAPRMGSTFGTLVSAPAHAEFVANDVQRTLTVTHDPLALRPLARGNLAQAMLAVTPTPPTAGLGVPKPESPESHATSLVAPSPAHVEPRPAFSESAPQTFGDPNAEAVLTAAVRACLAERPSAENVTISVNTTLHLSLRDDGTVRSAKFDPPVAPDVNACAAQSIYKTRFGRGGDVAIGVDFKASSSAP